MAQYLDYTGLQELVKQINDKFLRKTDVDTTFAEVVTKLPTDIAQIKKHLYLVKNGNSGLTGGDTNTSVTSYDNYEEYIYTGTIGSGATYDASKWEKLGDFRTSIDLADYSKKANTVKSIKQLTSTSGEDAQVYLQLTMDSGSTVNIGIAGAKNDSTAQRAGVMTAQDKKTLTTLANRYPLGIASFTVSPALVEVGTSHDFAFAWTLNNTDFHGVSSQGIVVDGAASVAVAVDNKSYTKTGLAGATSATTKKATLTVKSDTTVTKDVSITYHYPTYIGVVANGATINETAIKALTKSIEWGKGKTATLAQTNQKIVYAYPLSYGALTSIKDGNGFEGFGGYTRQTVQVGGQDYYVYVQNLPATASSKYTFA